MEAIIDLTQHTDEEIRTLSIMSMSYVKLSKVSPGVICFAVVPSVISIIEQKTDTNNSKYNYCSLSSLSSLPCLYCT